MWYYITDGDAFKTSVKENVTNISGSEANSKEDAEDTEDTEETESEETTHQAEGYEGRWCRETSKIIRGAINEYVTIYS